MRRKREEVGKEIIHLDGGDKLAVRKIVCWLAGFCSAFDANFSLQGFAQTLNHAKFRQTNERDEVSKGNKGQPLRNGRGERLLFGGVQGCNELD
jgi:hypothetical protein